MLLVHLLGLQSPTPTSTTMTTATVTTILLVHLFGLQFDGLVTAEHWIAMDDESVYVCEDSEVGHSNIVPMRCSPAIDPDVSTTDSWYIASAAPDFECEFVEVRFPYVWALVLADLERPAAAGEVICLHVLPYLVHRSRRRSLNATPTI